MAPDTLRRAHAVHPIAAMQSEYSLWTRGPELGMLQACLELGVAFVAFSPVARGALSGRVRDVEALPASDFRRNTPRFTGLNWKRNLARIDAYVEVARGFGRDPCELALAWVLAQGPHVLAIPGTRYVENLAHDMRAADKPLTAAEAQALAQGCRRAGRRATATPTRNGIISSATADTLRFHGSNGQYRAMTVTAPELADLLSKVAGRDRAAFAALYRATSAKLYGVVSRILPSGDAERGVAGGVREDLGRAADFDLAKGSPLAWMATIARNRALDEVRRARPISLEDMPEGFEPVAETEHPLESRSRAETYAALMRCLNALEPESARWSCSPIIAARAARRWRRGYKAPVGTVKTWLRRSLTQLKDCLSS